jgi:hypothetical protein
MDVSMIVGKRRALVNLAIGIAAVVLVVATRHVEAALAVFMPGLVLHWMVSNENRLLREGRLQAGVGLWTRIRLFFVLPMISILFFVFFAPGIWGHDHIQGLWGIESFAFGMLLFKVYTKFIGIRERLEGSAKLTKSDDKAVDPSIQSGPSKQIPGIHATQGSYSNLDKDRAISKVRLYAVIVMDVLAMTVLLYVVRSSGPASATGLSLFVGSLLLANFILLIRRKGGVTR